MATYRFGLEWEMSMALVDWYVPHTLTIEPLTIEL